MKNLVMVLIGVFIVGGGAFIWFTLQKRAESQSAATNPVNVALTSPRPIAQAAVPTSTPTSTLLSEIPLTVSSPADGAKLSSTQVTVSGVTAANADVSVNEVTTTADAKGNFSVSLTLDEGENYLAILAVDDTGRAAEKQLAVSVATFQQ